jgi:SOUL heme-binding protein
MKTLLIVSAVAVAVVLIIQTYIAMASDKSETQPYQLIKTEKDFEIRFYPAATMATITSKASTYKELGSSGFNKLAGYIFGGNNDNKQIAMTSPVHMNINDSASTMSFVMPSKYDETNLPKPKNSEVVISTTSSEYVAAITFGGYASDADIKQYTDKLEKALKMASISYYGHFRFLGYNAPFQFFNRKNEIIISVNWPLK